MSDNSLNILVVTFDQRPREKSLLDYLQERKVSHRVWNAHNHSSVNFLNELLSELSRQKTSHVLLIGLNKLAILWVIINYFVFRRPTVIRLGGDPIHVPASRYANACRNLGNKRGAALKSRIRLIATRWAIKLSKHFILVNKYLANKAIFADKNTIVQPPSPPFVVANERRSLQKDNVVRLLCVTNLNYFEKYRGVIGIVNSLGLMENASKVSLKVVGGGDYLPLLQNRLERADNRHQVELCGHQTDVNPFYEEADIFIYSSTLDAWPNVLMEAMAHGLPVVCNHHASFVEVFNDHQIPFLYSSEQWGTMNQDLEKLMADPDFWSARSSQSLVRVQEVRMEIRSSNDLLTWLEAISTAS